MNREKLRKKITDGKKNVRVEELVSLMNAYGFTNRRSKEGYFFTHPNLKGIMLTNVPIPHGRENKVREIYVTRCLDAIEMLEDES